MSRWYRYTVWTWVTGVWHLVLCSNDYGRASQAVRALQAYGYNSEYQRAVLSGPRTIVPLYRLRLVWNGQTYDYGDATELGFSQTIFLAALARLIRYSGAYATNLDTNRSTGLYREAYA